jgi:uncharacterized phiE125 gp8 family phage protein
MGGRFGSRLSLTGLPFRPDKFAIDLPGGKVASVEAVKYIDAAGAPQTLDAASYVEDLDNIPGRVAPLSIWPRAAQRAGAVTIDYTLDAMDEDDVALIRTAMLLIIAHWYRNRESVAVDVRGTPAALPNSVDWLLEDIRVGGLR